MNRQDDKEREIVKQQVIELNDKIREFCEKHHKGRSFHQALIISGLDRNKWESLRDSIGKAINNKRVNISRKRKTQDGKRGERLTLVERLTDFYNRLVQGTRKHLAEQMRDFNEEFSVNASFVKRSELIKGVNELYGCPNCKESNLSKYDNYCYGCGVKIIK